MIEHLPILIVVLPLIAAMGAPLAGIAGSGPARLLALVALAGSVSASAAALRHAIAEGGLRYAVAGWAPPWGIELVVDPLSGGMSLLVSAVALAVAYYAAPALADWRGIRQGLWYAVFLLLVAGLLGIVVTGDLFNLYVFLEISSLSAYALLSSSGDRAFVAAFRYLLVGTIAGSFYLLGVGYLYALTGTLNMADLAVRIEPHLGSPVVVVAVALMVIGLAIKSALFPLHGWLPDAYTFAPGHAVAFISAVMAKVSAYALFRILYFMLGARAPVPDVLLLLGWAAAIAAVAGSFMAVVQKDVRRMLAYSSVSQMGYVIMGLSIGTPAALIGALLHVLNHAVMKGCLFLIAGGLHWRAGIYRVRDFAGVSRRFPVTMAAFTLVAISMIGLPPTAGFFSKYYLALGAIETGHWFFLSTLVASSLLNAVYFFRIIERSYFLEAPAGSSAGELPHRMLVPIVGMASAVLLLGIFNQSVVSEVVRFALPS